MRNPLSLARVVRGDIMEDNFYEYRPMQQKKTIGRDVLVPATKAVLVGGGLYVGFELMKAAWPFVKEGIKNIEAWVDEKRIDHTCSCKYNNKGNVTEFVQTWEVRDDE